MIGKVVACDIDEDKYSKGKGRRKGNFSRKYPFSSRLYCGFCGSLLTRRNTESYKLLCNNNKQIIQTF